MLDWQIRGDHLGFESDRQADYLNWYKHYERPYSSLAFFLLIRLECGRSCQSPHLYTLTLQLPLRSATLFIECPASYLIPSGNLDLLQHISSKPVKLYWLL